MEDRESHAGTRSGSLLSVVALILLALFTLLLLYSIPGFRIGTIDEPWIGEQAYHLATDGVVRSTMFAGYADNEVQIFVYHKLLVWVAALLIKLFGLKLWLLRLISILSCLALFRLLFVYLRQMHAERLQYLITVVLLFACPLFFMRINIFRPEFLTAACGFASFYLISRALKSDSRASYILSGVAAGLAVLAHLNGVIFIVAGTVLLVVHKRYLPAATFTVVALIVSSFYFIDVFGHFGELVRQFAVSPGHPTRSLNPLVAFTNLVEEHKRLFRRPDIFGLSILYTFSLLYRWLIGKRFWTNDTIYAISLIISLGLINSNKTPTYAIPVFPFMAISVAIAFTDLLRQKGRAILKPIVIPLVALYLGYGIYADGSTAFSKREFASRRHSTVAAQLTPGATVAAPLKFMFNEINRFDIRAFEGIHLILDSQNRPFTMENIAHFADSIKADFLIVDFEFESDLNEELLHSDVNTLRPYEEIGREAGYLIFQRPNKNTQQ